MIFYMPCRIVPHTSSTPTNRTGESLLPHPEAAPTDRRIGAKFYTPLFTEVDVTVIEMGLNSLEDELPVENQQRRDNMEIKIALAREALKTARAYN